MMKETGQQYLTSREAQFERSNLSGGCFQLPLQRTALFRQRSSAVVLRLTQLLHPTKQRIIRRCIREDRAVERALTSVSFVTSLRNSMMRSVTRSRSL
jgi:hypothetical protein